jgi:hypothetical protein
MRVAFSRPTPKCTHIRSTSWTDASLVIAPVAPIQRIAEILHISVRQMPDCDQNGLGIESVSSKVHRCPSPVSTGGLPVTASSPRNSSA